MSQAKTVKGAPLGYRCPSCMQKGIQHNWILSGSTCFYCEDDGPCNYGVSRDARGEEVLCSYCGDQRDVCDC